MVENQKRRQGRDKGKKKQEKRGLIRMQERKID